MKLQQATWPEVEQYLSGNGSKGIVIPIGSTEQHGIDGAIGTDTICAEQVAWAAAQVHGEMLVAPTLALTPAQFNLGFCGTISVRSSTFTAVVCDVVDSLSRGGFTHIYFINGHGANIAAIRCAFHDLHQARTETATPLFLRLRSWWDFDAVDRLRGELYGEREGLHATPSEISITLASESIHGPVAATKNFKPLSATTLKSLGGDNHDVWFRHRIQHPDGRVGSDPGRSCKAHGAQLIEAGALELATDFQKFVTSSSTQSDGA